MRVGWVMGRFLREGRGGDLGVGSCAEGISKFPVSRLLPEHIPALGLVPFLQ